jgi:transposase
MKRNTKAYSEDLRGKAIKLVKEYSVYKVASMLEIGKSSIYLWIKQKRESGSFAPKKNWRKGYGNKVQDLEKFRLFVEENRGDTAKKMAEKLGGKMSIKTTCKWLHRIGYVRKKNLWIQGAR